MRALVCLWTRRFLKKNRKKLKKKTGEEPVLGHHPVTVALAAPHKWAWVVNKNPDRQP
jgi:hypothetical protein